MFPHGDTARAGLGADGLIVFAVEKAQGEDAQVVGREQLVSLSAQAAEALLVVLPAVIELRLGGVEVEDVLACALVAQSLQAAVAHGHHQVAFG